MVAFAQDLLGSRIMLRAYTGTLIFCVALLTLPTGECLAGPSDLDRQVRFQIPAQPLESALIEFSRQAQVPVAINSQALDDMHAPAVSGTLRVSMALVHLLNDSGLSYYRVGNTITVAPASARIAREDETASAQATATASVAGGGGGRSEASNSSSQTRGAAGVQEVVVTGNRFSDRTSLTSPVPVDIVSAHDLRGGGYTELTQSLEAEVPALSFGPVLGANGYSALRTFTYRGLPSSEVLVLVNGKRWHPATFLGPVTPLLGNVTVDLNSIPPTAINSAQILRDGASAQYGSDAIAGVLNLILRKDAGTELVATGGQYYRGDGDTAEFAFDSGHSLPRDGFIHASAYYRDSKTTNRQGTDVTQQYFALNSSGAPVATAVGNVFTQPLPAGLVFDPREFTGVDRNDNYVIGNSLRKEGGLAFSSELPVSDAATVYAFGGYTHREVETVGAWRAPRAATNLRAFFPNGYAPVFDPRISDVNVAAGVKGTAGKWDWDLSESWGFNKVAHYTNNTVNVSMGLASPIEFYRGFQRTEQATTNLDLKSSFDIGLSNPLKLATGAEFRYEKFEVGAGEPASYINGGMSILDGPTAGAAAPIGSQGAAGFTPTDAVNASRHSVAAYADVESQLTEKLLFTAAARVEDYSDFGSTVNGKVSFFNQVTSILAFRGSASTGFRAPSLLESKYSSTTSLVSAGQFFINRTFPVADPVARLLGAKDLDPEKSRSYSLGTTLAISEELNFTLDAYRLYLDDAIIPSSFFIGPAISSFLAANGYPGVNAAQFFINAVDKRVDGVDFGANYTKRFEGGSKLNLAFAVNINNPQVERVAPTPPQLAAITSTPLFDRRSVVIVERGTPRNRINLSATYNWRQLQFFLRETRYGSVEDIGLTPPATDQVYGAKWITDLDVAYDITDSVRLTAGGQNLFNVYPDKSSPANNPGGAIQYQSSFAFSPFGLNGGYYYLRALIRF